MHIDQAILIEWIEPSPALQTLCNILAYALEYCPALLIMCRIQASNYCALLRRACTHQKNVTLFALLVVKRG